MADDYATRRELDMLKAASDTEHGKLWARLESLDDHGSRGVTALAVRMDNLIKDVADVKSEVRTDVAEVKSDLAQVRIEAKAQADAHVKVHETEAADRRGAVRFRIMATIGAAASVATVIGLLVEVLAHVH